MDFRWDGRSSGFDATEAGTPWREQREPPRGVERVPEAFTPLSAAVSGSCLSTGSTGDIPLQSAAAAGPPREPGGGQRQQRIGFCVALRPMLKHGPKIAYGGKRL
jgi:hypothetical protein